VRAALVFDQAGIDRGRERRIIEGHGHIGRFGPADFLPCRADIVARRLHAEIGGALVVALVVGNLDIECQDAQRASEAVLLCGEVKVPMLTMTISPYRVEPGGDSASSL
jgi:hypothetical protein